MPKLHPSWLRLPVQLLLHADRFDGVARRGAREADGFRRFVESASKLLCEPDVPIRTADSTNSGPLTPLEAAAGRPQGALDDKGRAQCEAFSSLVAEGWRVVGGPLAKDIERLRRFAERVSKWQAPHDLLAVAGLSFVEDCGGS